jgi:hypothetical protein
VNPHDYLTLDTTTGHLFWKARTRNPNMVEGQRAGHLGTDGYRYVSLNCRQLLEHRVIFFMCNGRWPQCVDHINLDRADNRPENLREASVTQNNRNRGRQSNNTSGYKGVSFHRPTGRWTAKIMAHHKRHSLGYYPTAELAHAAYVAAAARLHGDFAHG